MRINMNILEKRLRLTGTAAPADKPVAVLLPREWHELLREECAPKAGRKRIPLACYLRSLVRARLVNSGRLASDGDVANYQPGNRRLI